MECVTGLKKENIVNDEGRGIIIRKEIHKLRHLGKRIELPIETLFGGKALKIINYYKEEMANSPYVLPQYSHQEINRTVKVIIHDAGINKKREFNEFVSSCKFLGIIEPNNFEELISMDSYSDRFTNPLSEFKRDLFRAGVLTFSIYLLETCSSMKLYKALKKQGVEVNIDISDIVKSRNKAGEELKSYFRKWMIDKAPIEHYLTSIKDDPSSAFKELISEIYPILEKYINEDDLPKN